MKLNQIADNAGARPARTRVGRGIGSTKGKTAGRGQKGQKSRTGVSIRGFEGGQMPIYRRLPKRGFTNIHRVEYAELTVARLAKVLAAGKLDLSKPVSAEVLRAAGVIHKIHSGLRLIGTGELGAKITLEVAGITKGARAAVEAAGGTVTVIGAPAEPETEAKPEPKKAKKAKKDEAAPAAAFEPKAEAKPKAKKAKKAEDENKA